MYEFAYEKPRSIADAVRMLSADPEARPLAGGQTFIPVLKQRLSRPTSVVDLGALGLSGIKAEPGKITIGAMTNHMTIATSEEIGKSIPGLAKMASWIGDNQVRHRGTMGGSVANADPSACYPAALLAMGATIVTDKRRVAVDDFFQGLFTTALEPGELVTSIEIPIPEKSNYEKFRNPASRYAMVGVFVAKGPAGVRVAITGAGQNGVFRQKEMEAALMTNWSPDAIANIKTPADGLNSDIHASAEYRAHLITVMAKRAVAGA
jgi:aerobic carbon-monoxide dehydrogenase medium subunit